MMGLTICLWNCADSITGQRAECHGCQPTIQTPELKPIARLEESPIWMFPKIVVVFPPNHPLQNRVFPLIIHHPFWGISTLYFWGKHLSFFLGENRVDVAYNLTR